MSSCKGQFEVFGEFLGFAIGLITVFSISYIFSGHLSPLIISEAMSFHMENLLRHVEAAASQINYYIDTFENKEIILRLNLPLNLVGYNYEVYTDNDSDLCIRIFDTEYSMCKDNPLMVHASFTSGRESRLSIKLEGLNKIIKLYGV